MPSWISVRSTGDWASYGARGDSNIWRAKSALVFSAAANIYSPNSILLYIQPSPTRPIEVWSSWVWRKNPLFLRTSWSFPFNSGNVTTWRFKRRAVPRRAVEITFDGRFPYSNHQVEALRKNLVLETRLTIPF